MYNNIKDEYVINELPYDCLVLQNPFYEERGEKPIIEIVTVDVKPLIDDTIDDILDDKDYVEEDGYMYKSAIRSVFDKLSGAYTGYTYDDLKKVYEFFREALNLDSIVQPIEGHTKEECIREILEYFIYKAYDEEGYEEHSWTYEMYVVDDYTTDQTYTILSYVEDEIYKKGYDVYMEALEEEKERRDFYRTHTGL